MVDTYDKVLDMIKLFMEDTARKMGFDQTIMGKIVKASSPTGVYIVDINGQEFTAFSEIVNLNIGEAVYITIPKGDYSLDKIIIGRMFEEEKNKNKIKTREDFLAYSEDILGPFNADQLNNEDGIVSINFNYNKNLTLMAKSFSSLASQRYKYPYTTSEASSYRVITDLLNLKNNTDFSFLNNKTLEVNSNEKNIWYLLIAYDTTDSEIINGEIYQPKYAGIVTKKGLLKDKTTDVNYTNQNGANYPDYYWVTNFSLEMINFINSPEAKNYWYRIYIAIQDDDKDYSNIGVDVVNSHLKGVDFKANNKQSTDAINDLKKLLQPLKHFQVGKINNLYINDILEQRYKELYFSCVFQPKFKNIVSGNYYFKIKLLDNLPENENVQTIEEFKIDHTQLTGEIYNSFVPIKIEKVIDLKPSTIVNFDKIKYLTLEFGIDNFKDIKGIEKNPFEDPEVDWNDLIEFKDFELYFGQSIDEFDENKCIDLWIDNDDQLNLMTTKEYSNDKIQDIYINFSLLKKEDGFIKRLKTNSEIDNFFEENEKQQCALEWYSYNLGALPLDPVKIELNQKTYEYPASIVQDNWRMCYYRINLFNEENPIRENKVNINFNVESGKQAIYKLQKNADTGIQMAITDGDNIYISNMLLFTNTTKEKINEIVYSNEHICLYDNKNKKIDNILNYYSLNKKIMEKAPRYIVVKLLSGDESSVIPIDNLECNELDDYILNPEDAEDQEDWIIKLPLELLDNNFISLKYTYEENKIGYYPIKLTYFHTCGSPYGFYLSLQHGDNQAKHGNNKIARFLPILYCEKKIATDLYSYESDAIYIIPYVYNQNFNYINSNIDSLVSYELKFTDEYLYSIATLGYKDDDGVEKYQKKSSDGQSWVDFNNKIENIKLTNTVIVKLNQNLPEDLILHIYECGYRLELQATINYGGYTLQTILPIGITNYNFDNNFIINGPLELRYTSENKEAFNYFDKKFNLFNGDLNSLSLINLASIQPQQYKQYLLDDFYNENNTLKNNIYGSFDVGDFKLYSLHAENYINENGLQLYNGLVYKEIEFEEELKDLYETKKINSTNFLDEMSQHYITTEALDLINKTNSYLQVDFIINGVNLYIPIPKIINKDNVFYSKEQLLTAFAKNGLIYGKFSDFNFENKHRKTTFNYNNDEVQDEQNMYDDNQCLITTIDISDYITLEYTYDGSQPANYVHYYIKPTDKLKEVNINGTAHPIEYFRVWAQDFKELTFCFKFSEPITPDEFKDCFVLYKNYSSDAFKIRQSKNLKDKIIFQVTDEMINKEKIIGQLHKSYFYTNNNSNFIPIKDKNFYIKNNLELIDMIDFKLPSNIDYINNNFSINIVWIDQQQNGYFLFYPILTEINKYPSTLINKWDGQTKVQTGANGYMSATQLISGNMSGNLFTGVVVGNPGGADADTDLLSQGNGLYGFHNGKKTYSLTEQGKMTLGQDESELILDGINSVMQNKNYLENKVGMKIDLGNETIYSNSLSLESSNIKLKNNSDLSYLQIINDNNKTLANIGKNIYTLQSNNYQNSLKPGLSLDLENGLIQIHNGQISITNNVSESKYYNDYIKALYILWKKYNNVFKTNTTQIFTDDNDNKTVIDENGKFKFGNNNGWITNLKTFQQQDTIFKDFINDFELYTIDSNDDDDDTNDIDNIDDTVRETSFILKYTNIEVYPTSTTGIFEPEDFENWLRQRSDGFNDDKQAKTASTIANFLATKMNLSDCVIIGLLANFWHESNWVYDREGNLPVYNEIAYGFMQWSDNPGSTNRTELFNWCGTNTPSLDQQLKYFQWWMPKQARPRTTWAKENWKDPWSMLENLTDNSEDNAALAASIFCACCEVPANGQRGESQNNVRIETARKLYRELI